MEHFVPERLDGIPPLWGNEAVEEKFDSLDPVAWLLTEYSRRRARGSGYSLRAFARFLQVPSGPLSEILNRKRSLSRRLAKQLSERLGHSEAERSRFLSAVPARSPRHEGPRYLPLDLEVFSLIADWYHFALLSLVETRGFEPSLRRMAKRLNLSLAEARTGWARLKRIGLVKKRSGTWVSTGPMATPTGVPSEAGRRFHQQGLEQALRALDEVPLCWREFGAMTMAIDVSRLPEARKAMAEFRKKMAALLEQGDRTEVFRLQLQLFPLTRIQEVPSHA